MINLIRSEHNPVLLPSKSNTWEAEATFNPSVVERNGFIHAVYRAVSASEDRCGVNMEVSSIGHGVSKDGVHFEDRTQLIKPDCEWDKYGCEDPRITEFEGRYFIFYTALSTYPFSAEGIKVGVAITKDFKTFEKHLITPFNAKAMALFPERVNGKITALLTVHTDQPPARICLAYFDKIEDMWSLDYWNDWCTHLDDHVLHLDKAEKDHIEFGAPPIKTSKGWLIFYSYIYNYFSPPAIFGIQAALLDLKNPANIIGKVKRPFMVPQEEYEQYGKVPNIVFPSGALIRNREVYLYYGAADTTSCMASMGLWDIVEQLIVVKKREFVRFEGNPIISPISDHEWESKATFNPAAVELDGTVHVVYRAMSGDNTSMMGYASSEDGLHIAHRLPSPIYTPVEEFETKQVPGGNSGCEDPRITKMGDTLYMCYTAFTGKDFPRVALTSISIGDFLKKNWTWTKPILISSPGVDDKDAALFPEKIKNKYVFLHRLGDSVWIDFVDDLKFQGKFLAGTVLIGPRETLWDSRRIGIAGPPIKTSKGWLLLYHGISKRSGHYNIRAMLLDKNDPSKVRYRIHDPIFEPRTSYEREGLVPNVVFPCGNIIKDKKLFIYYGGADKVVGVATVPLADLLEGLLYDSKHK